MKAFQNYAMYTVTYLKNVLQKICKTFCVEDFLQKILRKHYSTYLSRFLNYAQSDELAQRVVNIIQSKKVMVQF